MSTRGKPTILSCALLLATGCAVAIATIDCNGVLGIPEVTRLLDAGPSNRDAANRQASACPSDQKECDGTCVSVLDPRTGCALSACTPCAPPHAKAACGSGDCIVESCDEGFADCNADRKDGCEANLAADPKNCDACGKDCGAFGCADGACACLMNATCGAGGRCDRLACVCDGTRCEKGVGCDDLGDCAK